MTIAPPPTQNPIVTDDDGMIPIDWALFFDAIFKGDAGTEWIPTFSGLSISGGLPVFSGRVYKISQYLAYFVVQIQMPSGVSVTGTAGSYYINNFPEPFFRDAPCALVTGNLGTVGGMCSADSNFIYPPSISGVTAPITITGTVELLRSDR